MPNKPFSREIVDICTGQMTVFGFKRKRYGLVLKRSNDEMTLGICISHRECPPQIVDLSVYGFVFWEPVERIYAEGLGKKYRFTETVTRTRWYSPPADGGPPYLFEQGADHQSNLSRLIKQVETVVLPNFDDLSNPDSTGLELKEHLSAGGGFPEKYLAMRIWQQRTTEIDTEFEQVVSSVPKGLIENNVKAFSARLQESEVVEKILFQDSISQA